MPMPIAMPIDAGCMFAPIGLAAGAPPEPAAAPCTAGLGGAAELGIVWLVAGGPPPLIAGGLTEDCMPPIEPAPESEQPSKAASVNSTKPSSLALRTCAD